MNINKFWLFIERVVEKIVILFCKAFHKQYKEEYKDGLMQFIKFGIVGVSNTAVSYITYVIALLIFRKLAIFSGIDYVIAQAVSFFVGVTWSFYWNNRFVFTDKKRIGIIKSFVRVLLSYAFTGLFISSLLLYMWVNILHVSEYVAPLLNLIISVPLNFILNKLWAFPTANNRSGE